jgi:Na+/proline symporter
MSQKIFSLLASVIFFVVALAHAARLVFKLPVSLDSWAAPMWVSWVALIVALYLASEGFRLARKS